MGKHVVVDIGGSSARCFVAEYDGDAITLTPLYTFANSPIQVNGEWFWNARGLFEGIKTGLALAGERFGDNVDSIGIDSMGNAFGLLDAKGDLLEPPPYTRIPQEKRIEESLFRRIGAAELYGMVGLERSKQNSLYHLIRYQVDKPELLARAKRFLMLPDLLCHWLTGETASEYSIASTSCLLDAFSRDWSRPLMSRLGLDPGWFPRVAPTGTVLGKLRRDLADAVGLRRAVVVMIASHDTSSAILCVDDRTPASAFISSGTWGMLGCKLANPLLTAEALQANFANEGAAFGRIQFVHNSPSMSLLQKCREEWAAVGREMAWGELFAAAERAEPFAALLDIEAACFRGQGGMLDQIEAYCRETAQDIPRQPGQVTRAILESIAVNYMQAMHSLDRLVDARFEELTIVGGASQAGLLLQFIADALGRRLAVGPVESTSLGNCLVQLLALGEIKDIDQGRQLLGRFMRPPVLPGGRAEEWRRALAGMHRPGRTTAGPGQED